MRPKYVVEALKFLLADNAPALLVGSPGLGKTDMVHQACIALDMDLQVSHPVTDEPIDAKGLPAVVDGKADFLPYGQLLRLIEAERPLCAFLDDLGQANPAVQASYMQMILAREISGHKISPHVTFLAATNRKADMAGVSGILEPVKSRFMSIIEVEAHVGDWSDWAAHNGVPVELIALIQLRGHPLLHNFKPTAEIENTPSPRTVAQAGRIFSRNPPKSIEYDLYKGAAGEGFAREFVGFLRVWRDMPDPDAVLKNPEAYKIPSEPDVAYAICAALADRVTKGSMPNFVKLLLRFREHGLPEYGVMAMNLAIGRDEKLEETKAYIQWQAENQDVVV